MPKRTATQNVRYYANRVRESTRLRDESIRAMRAEGASLRAISRECGLTVTGVRKILLRSP